ncbi:MAG: hypothetical protein OXH76_09880 [Boseongicola sp.]|nr:hypothetical protein [Boseongicola sp.]
MAKATRSGTPRDGLAVRSFCTLLDDLSGEALNQPRLPGHGKILPSVVTAHTGTRIGPSISSA